MRRTNKIGAKGVYACKDCLTTPSSILPKKKRPPCAHCGGSVEYFSSKREFTRWHELAMELRAGLITGLKIHPHWDFTMNGVLIGSYTADSSCHVKGGGMVVEDVKGYMNSAMKEAFSLRKGIMLAFYENDVKIVK